MLVTQSCLTLRSYGLWPAKLHDPWNSQGKNSRVDSHSLLQGDLPDPGIKSRSPALPANSLPSELPKWAMDVVSEDLEEPSLGEWQVAAHRECNIRHWSEHYWFKHEPHNQGTWKWSWKSLGLEEACLCWFLLAVTGHFGEESMRKYASQVTALSRIPLERKTS